MEEAPQTGLRAALALDLRSLAALRIWLGLGLFLDLALRARALRAHYTDAGIVTRADAVELFGRGSLHLLFGSVAGQAALFAIAAVFALMLAAGLFTRVAAVASYVLLLSLRHRNPLVGDYGDMTAQVLLLWAMFLPLGARASLDALRRAPAPLPHRIFGLASAAWILQVLITYSSAAVHKAANAEWYLGREVWFVVNLDARATQLARLLIPHPFVCQLMTWGALALELLGPLLLLVPRRVNLLRSVLFVVFVGLHASFALILRLGIFPVFSVAMWIPLLPGELWARLGARARGLVETVGAAAQALAARLPRAGPIKLEPGRLGRPLLVLVLVVTELWTVLQLPLKPPPAVARLEAPLHALGLDQEWTMFEGRYTEDGWWVARATTARGREVDLVTRDALSWKKPADVGARYGPQRWSNLLFALSQLDDGPMLQHLGWYLCARWNRDHGDDPVHAAELDFMLERTTLTGEEPPVKEHKLTVACPGR